MIHTGMFNKKITIVKSKDVINEFGARSKSADENFLKIYGYLSNFRNNEFWESRRRNDKSKLRLRIRFHRKMLEVNNREFYVIIDNLRWNILSIENVLERNREFLLYLEKRDEDKNEARITRD